MTDAASNRQDRPWTHQSCAKDLAAQFAGVLRLGFLANFLSHPVIAGFITATGILIATSHLRYIFGIEAHGHTMPHLLASLFAHFGDVNWITVLIGVAATAFLFSVRKYLNPLLRRIGLPHGVADILTKASPVAVIVATTLIVWQFGLQDRGIQIVGEVLQSLPPFTLPELSPDLIGAFVVPAILISIIGFVESISVAQTLAAKKCQQIDPD